MLVWSSQTFFQSFKHGLWTSTERKRNKNTNYNFLQPRLKKVIVCIIIPLSISQMNWR